MMMDGDVVKMIEIITSSGCTDLSSSTSSSEMYREVHQNLKSLKKLCRDGGETTIQSVFRCLMIQLEKKHLQIRITTLLVMNELFMRSHNFRSLLLTRGTFNQFLELIGVKISEDKSRQTQIKLPPPKELKPVIMRRSLEILKIWNDKFSSGYPLLSSAIEFMSNNGVDFIQYKITDPLKSREERRLENMRRETLEKKMNETSEKYKILEPDVQAIITQVDSCLEILYPKPDDHEDDTLHDGTEDVKDDKATTGDKDTPGVSGILQNNTPVTIDISKPTPLTIRKNDDTKDVLDTLRELYQQLVKKYLEELKEIMSSLTEGSGDPRVEAILKSSIDLKVKILFTISKIADMNILDDTVMSGDDETSDDDFEDVPEKEGLETVIPLHERSLYGMETSETSVIKPIDPNAKTCRVLLPSGKLCPRMDLIKCPFHGVIVKRDATGVALSEDDRLMDKKREESSVPEWQEASFLRDIQAATGIDLTLSSTRRKRKKYPNLIDVKDDDKRRKDPRKNLEKKIFNKDRMARIAQDLDDISSQNQKQFEDNWSYALNT